ncbi:hypothetical protein [Dongia sp.]|uniref:hypothetical protein n=1 Tax=Dongia sp. TaxID=1977262 RepID=UPI0035AD8F29
MAGATNLIKRIGRRNIGYVLFTALITGIGLLLEAGGPQGPDSGGGIMFGLIVWGLTSLVFFLVNLVLLIRDLMRQQPAGKALLACALPIIAIVGTLVVEEVTMSVSSSGGAGSTILDNETAQG